VSQPHDPNATADAPASPADSPDPGPTRTFGTSADPTATTDHTPGSASTGGSQPGADAPATELPAVPGYRVFREIARGGMGRVLAAFDLALDRDVAIKVLLPGANPDRFLRESRITARLPHPSIPPVHALGTLADGSPFLAMKLVVGRTLAAEMKSADRPHLLRAFTQVCEAVGFAHSRGVIHRDLKPANVMVGEFGEVQVMDWGLAKDLTSLEASHASGSSEVPLAPPVDTDADQTTDRLAPSESTGDQTRAGTVLGTPAYMAPEVAVGKAATRAADVYGLGAILYSLLCGRPPYTGASASDVLKKVATTDPDLFTGANRSLPPALVAICRQAMARNPELRYASADEVAADVRRWLAGDPISVYREPWTDRVVRWARRRKTAVVAAAVLLLTTAVAATTTAGLVWREQRVTEGEKVKATENADTAITVVRNLSSYLSAVEASGGQPASDQVRRARLDAAVVSYERLLALHPDDADVRSNVALTHRYRANLCRLLNETGEAEKSYHEARRHYGELAAAHPGDSGYRINLAVTSRDYALYLKTLGRLKESTEILDVSIRVYEELWQADPDKATYQRTLAMMLLDRAELDYLVGNMTDAERNARRSADLYARLAEKAAAIPEPLDPIFRGMAEIRLAIALRELGRIDDALTVHDRVVERFAGLARISGTRDNLHEYYRSQAERAMTLARVPGRRAAGVADLDSAIAGCEKLVKQFPQVPAYLRSQGSGTLYRGRLKVLLGQHEAAAQDLTAAAKIFEGLVGKYPDIPVYRSFLGQTYVALGQLDADPKKSAEWYRKAREMLDGAVRRSPENAQDRKALSDLDALTKFPNS
jgi:serine/threonine protein kinase/tetratricopeptide (TPR) repeat protein